MAFVAADPSAPRAPSRFAPGEFRNRNIHMIGIGGSGMSGLAALLLQRGARVSGSECRSSLTLARLLESGARITTRQDAHTLADDAELVVASAAIPHEHPELREARRRRITILKYSELLGALMDHYHGVAVSGTHGKSTTSAWLTFVLQQAGLDPSFVIGAVANQLGGGSGIGDGPHFVAEACEYDRSFLNLRPRCAAVLNIEEDHLDCYRDLADITDAFERFVASIPDDGLVVLNADDPRCLAIAGSIRAGIETFGFSDEAVWRASALSLTGGTHSFDMSYAARSLGRVTINLAGIHNVANALAVTALAHHCGVRWDTLRRALADFRGVKRRLELRAKVAGVWIVDDYGHHPTEIRATLQAARERFAPRRLWCIFQPHQHSRTRFLLDDFARSFDLADRVVVPDIYFVRDTQREREAISAEDLVKRIRARGGEALYIPRLDAIVDPLSREVSAGDLVLTMGAGNIWKVADDLVRRLGGDLPD